MLIFLVLFEDSKLKDTLTFDVNDIWHPRLIWHWTSIYTKFSQSLFEKIE